MHQVTFGDSGTAKMFGKRKLFTAKVAGTEYTIRPINLGPLRKLTEAGHVQAITAYQIAGIQNQPVTPEMESKFLNGIVAVLSASLGVEEQFIWENVNLEEASVICAIIYMASGLIEKGDNPKAPAGG